MASLNGFNAAEVEPNGDFEPIPENKYLVAIIESIEKPTKNGNGTYLELQFEVLEGQYKGRLLWDRLNLNNPNELTVQIARGELSAICRAVRVMAPKDSCELHNLPLVARVTVRKREDTGALTNEIKGYYPKDAAAETVLPAADPKSPQSQAPTRQVPPWARKAKV